MNKKHILLAAAVIAHTPSADAQPNIFVVVGLLGGITSAAFFSISYGIKYAVENAKTKRHADDFAAINAITVKPDASIESFLDVYRAAFVENQINHNGVIRLADYCAAHNLNIETIYEKSFSFAQQLNGAEKMLMTKLSSWGNNKGDDVKIKRARELLSDKKLTTSMALYQSLPHTIDRYKKFIKLYVAYDAVTKKDYKFTGNKFSNVVATEERIKDVGKLDQCIKDLDKLRPYHDDSTSYHILRNDMVNTMNQLNKAITTTTSAKEYSLLKKEKELTDKENKNNAQISEIRRLNTLVSQADITIKNLEAKIDRLTSDFSIESAFSTQRLQSVEKELNQKKEELTKITKEKEETKKKLEALEKKVANVKDKIDKSKGGYSPTDEVAAFYIKKMDELKNDLS